MKRIASLLIALTSGTFGSISIYAYGEEACDLSTLQGQYVWTGRADRAPDDSQTNFPRIFAGALNFDGEGDFSGTFTASFGGTITPRGTTGGTYALDSDCTGSLIFMPGGTNWDLFVISSGSEAQLIRTEEGTVATRTISAWGRERQGEMALVLNARPIHGSSL
jgi:hypothetical protein